MRDKKLTVVIPGKLSSSKELIGFKFCSPPIDQQDLPIFC